MKISIKYGHTEEEISFSDGDRVHVGVPPPGLPSPADQLELVRQALAEPIETGLLRDLSRGKKNAVILISDHTRPTPSRLILPLLVEALQNGGLTPDKIAVMVACGLHARPGPEAVEKILGKDLCGQLAVAVHDPDDRENLVDIGKTAMGTPIEVNRAAAEADLLLSISTIEPHRFYGWSGGAKNLLPGVSSRKTVYTHHGRFAQLITGLDVMDNNPHREDAEEAAEMVGLDFICNVVLDEQRRIVGAFAGDQVSAHRAGVELGRRLNVTTLPEKADILVCALGGSPRDADFWQAEGKAMMHTQHLVKDGGVMIMAAGCEEGIGGEAFEQLLRKTPQEIKKTVAENDYSVPLMKADDVATVSGKIDLCLVCPGIGPSDLPGLPVRFFAKVQEALDQAKAGAASPPHSIIVVPDSSRVVVSVDARQ
jgi:nickel-dependent lactate racemase